MTDRSRPALNALLNGMSPAVVLDRLAVPVLVVEGRVICFANPAFAEMLGRPVAELTGVPLATVLTDPAAGGPVPGAGVTTWRHADGYPVHARVSGLVSLPGADGVVMVAFTDVTEQAWAAD